MGVSASRSVVATADNTSTGLKYVTGWSIEETAGATATVYLRDQSNTGTKFIRIKLAANESVNMEYSSPVMFSQICFVNISAGSVNMTVFGY